MTIKPLKPRSVQRKQVEEKINAHASLKTRLEIYKLLIETVVLFLGLVSLIAFSLGAAFTFLYFSRIHFNSGGITWSDAVSVVFLVSGFFGFTIILLAYSTFAGFPIARLLHFIATRLRKVFKKFQKRQIELTKVDPLPEDKQSVRTFTWKKGNGFLVFCGIFVLLIFIVASLSFSTGVRIYFLAILAGGTVLSFSIFGIFEHRNRPKLQEKTTSRFWLWFDNQSETGRHLILSLAFISVTVILFFGVGQDASVTMADIRKQNATVRLNKDDFQQFVQRATRLGLAINPCETLDHDSTIITGVDVLWHKLGTKGLLRYPTQPIGADSGEDRPAQDMRIELDNSSFSILEEHNASKFEPICAEIPSAKLFSLPDARLTDQGREMLEQRLQWLTKIPNEWKIRIFVHSSAPADADKNKSSSNSGSQASEIKNFLVQKFHIKADRINAFGKENAEPKQECAAVQSLFGKRDCDAMNRRIEVFAAKDF